jgi:hypothetical protein
MKVSIIIPTYLRSDKLKRCLETIEQYTDFTDTEVIVVANGAPLETGEICHQYESKPWFVWAWYEEPLGYPKACNAGLKLSTAEYVVLLNDDCELLPQPKNQWIDVLLEPFLKDERVGITGPQRLYDENSRHEFLIFFCVMLRRKCLDELGLLDESTGIGFGEDTIACIEAERRGWKVLQVPDNDHVNTLAENLGPEVEAWKHDKLWCGNFPLWHDAESTLGRMPNSEEALNRNRAMLRERYRVQDPMICDVCGTPRENGVCIPCQEKTGLKLWRAACVDGWFGADELHWLATVVKNRGKVHTARD